MDSLPGDDPVAVALVGAVREGDLPALRRLLAEHPGLATVRVAGRDGCARTPLHVACDGPGTSRTGRPSCGCCWPPAPTRTHG
ncbi:hypothetical protein [Geodermatophilus sp. CPCC 205506]|uniref:hypothetical protein n=1 Tax=Geodermatophilus sp. CPCC 205506 TaxID=2936596 RepID=UPI003EE91DDF